MEGGTEKRKKKMRGGRAITTTAKIKMRKEPDYGRHHHERQDQDEKRAGLRTTRLDSTPSNEILITIVLYSQWPRY